MLARALALEPEVLLLDEPDRRAGRAGEGGGGAHAGRARRPLRAVARAGHPRARAGGAAGAAGAAPRRGQAERMSIDITLVEVAATLSLVAIAAAASLWRRAELEQDLAVAVLRSFLQLTAVGYVIQAIFDSDSLWLVALLLVRHGGVRQRDRPQPREGGARSAGADRAGAVGGRHHHARPGACAGGVRGRAALPRAGGRDGHRQLHDRGGGGSRTGWPTRCARTPG